jgi:hypothetical protein
MAHQKPESVVGSIRGGTGTALLAPPWSRGQVKWIGRGIFVLRLAADESSRWLVAGSFRWNHVFPHEKTFQRSAAEKAAVISRLQMNPWPAHLASRNDAAAWRSGLAEAVSRLEPVFDTGYSTLWRLEELPRPLWPEGDLVVLDGHHSRRAQKHLGLKRLFGWVEPLEAPELRVRAIERAGWLAAWLDGLVREGVLRALDAAPDAARWRMGSSAAFEVLQSDRRWWCEVARLIDGETVVDALTRLSRGAVMPRTSTSPEELMAWLERLEIDTALRLPPPDKAFLRDRALARRPFPQKSTYFHPKLPFGALVEDLR